MLLFWRFREHKLLMLTVVLCLIYQNLSFCWSLNSEGLALLRFKQRLEDDPYGALSDWKDADGEENPCSWVGVQCSEGNVRVLNLKDLCLKGTLAPDLGKLVHIKSIILRNNAFSGTIPPELANLKELKMLDLGCNNISGPLPLDLGNNWSLAILLVDNSNCFSSICPETNKLKTLSGVQVDENKRSSAAHVTSCHAAQYLKIAPRKLLQGSVPDLLPSNFKWFFFQPPPPREFGFRRVPPPSVDSPSPSPSPASSFLSSPRPSTTMFPNLSPSVTGFDSAPPFFSQMKSATHHHHRTLIFSAAIGGPFLLSILIIVVLFVQSKKVALVRPCATGLSGQLRKAFVTGVPKLKRSEIEAACEDFSNVIGSLSVGTLYKGTLSSGVEIAVVSLAVASAKDWSKIMETRFQKKIETLSKVNHRNIVNLLGYCEEEEPFTRMIVFEYAPNGTLFEHLHIKEAEHLNWAMRMRIAMGIAYCLDYMHQSAPSIPHRTLNSCAVYLTEDYAAKLSDFGFSNELSAAETEPDMPSNVYSYGVILFEMITGRLPYSVDNGSLEDWASDYLREAPHLMEIVDPTLEYFQEEQLEELGRVIKLCANPDPEQRPGMREVTARLSEITLIGPDGALPKHSPLWWAELEILSTEVN